MAKKKTTEVKLARTTTREIYLEKLLAEAVADRNGLTDTVALLTQGLFHAKGLAERETRLHVEAANRASLLEALNSQLRANLGTYRARFISDVTGRVAMEAKNWGLDLHALLDA
jgi:hypothetical protein